MRMRGPMWTCCALPSSEPSSVLSSMHTDLPVLRLGLVVNPCAGVGGPVALKGSDGAGVYADALRRGGTARATDRAAEALAALEAYAGQIELTTWGGAMGEDSARDAGLQPIVAGHASEDHQTDADDTRAAVRQLRDSGIEVLLFAGGDGTARDILEVVGDRLPVLGIPAGVKMHSGVYAINPASAGRLLCKLVSTGWVDLVRGEVRDIDEEAFREGEVRTRFFGEMLVPDDQDLLQQVKCAGQAGEEEILQGLAAWVVETMQAGCTYVIGPGSTTAAVMQELGLEFTLLGVDVIRDGGLLARDAAEREILALVNDTDARIMVTAIGGQGHILGRGNQQISPRVIHSVGPEHIQVLATREKLRSLDGRALRVDSGDPELDRALCGHLQVFAGYEDRLFYPVQN